MNATVASTHVRHFPVIRVFVSSTFSDLVEERNALAEKVWPELERYCRQRGFTFQAIDLRWGVPSEAGLDHRTMQICFEELRRAQEASPEPNFLILLGDKYGWRPLPETISEAEYTHLREHAQSPDEAITLADWYRRDANAIPPHHILRARTDSPDGQDYTRVADADGQLRDTAAWLAVQETLWAIVNRAYPDSLLRERFSGETDDMPASVRFQGSATEQEIWHGALQVENAREHVVAWFRKIVTTDGNPEPSQLKRFVDLRPDQSPDLDAAAALAELKTQVEQALAPEPVLHAQCRWATDASGAFIGEVTTDHLAPMCEAILTRLRALILRQINDYWGTDLSAEDATVAAVRGTQHELDLELRDHQRFARERGPVDGFIGRDEQVRTLRDYLQATTNRPLIVHGPSGSGKTALLAYVAQQPFPPGAEAGGVSPLILRRFIGTHPESSTLRGLMTSLCREQRVHFPIQEPLPDTQQKLIEEFYAQLAHATANQPIYVFLDALDQLEAADQSRECFWLRSHILPQAGEAPCHARIVASCLSPSPEFPPESDACEPFRRLQTRGLLADEELGALSETAACKLLRQWLVIQKRGLTEDQWNHVDASIRESSERRQPLYLRALIEQLREWHSLKTPKTLPASLAQLIQETLTHLCQPNQHGPLPRITLGYLVSARYGLSEGELLEVLLLDPEMQAQLEAAGKAYGHRLPPEAKRYPVAPWARLRSDLRAYLSERAAPGTTVLSCYHRQVEQAVRTLFLADEPTRAERRRLLADYFDTRWNQPDAHALMELPDLLLALPDHRWLNDRLTNFAFPMRKAEVGLLETLSGDYTRLSTEGPADLRAPLQVWQDFFREQAYLLRRGVADTTAHNILLQLALEHAKDSPVTVSAERWLSTGRCDWLRLQRVPRQERLTPNPCQAVMEGHTSSDIDALLLPNRQVLSWSSDRTLRVWDTADGSCHAVLEGHTGRVHGVLLLPDGYILTLGGGEKTLRVWDMADGSSHAILEGHTDSVHGALLLPGGRILSWGADKTLRVWDMADRSSHAVLEGHTDSVHGALLLPGGRILSWGADKTLRVWDMADGSSHAILEGHTDSVHGALLLPNGRILSWGADKTLRVWDMADGYCHAVLEGHADSVHYALLLPNGHILSCSGHSWSSDATLRIWDPSIGICLVVLEGHTDSVIGALPLPSGRVLSWSEDATLRVWEAASGACRAVLKGHILRVRKAVLMPDDRILSWSWDGTLRVWDADTGTCLITLDADTGRIDGALLLPDNCILSWARDATLRVWDTTIGARRAVPEGHKGYVVGALPLAEGRILSWSGDWTLRVWDMVDGACRAVLEGHTDRVNGVLLLPDGRILSWGEDKTLRVWDVTTLSCRIVLEGHTEGVKGALLLSDGRILSWSQDKTLRVWDAVSGNCSLVLKGHTGQVYGAAAQADGRVVSWSDWDKTVRIWDVATGDCVRVVKVTDDMSRRFPHWFEAKQPIKQPHSVADGWSANAKGRTARLFHLLGVTPQPAWQAESNCEARILQPDGTLVVTQANGQVCILKLHHGNRRVSLAEAEEILRAGGK